MRPARWIIADDTERALVIQDLGPGPGEERMTVHQDASRIVRDLVQTRRLRPGQRLLLFSPNGMTEILVRDGAYAGTRTPQGAPA